MGKIESRIKSKNLYGSGYKKYASFHIGGQEWRVGKVKNGYITIYSPTKQSYRAPYNIIRNYDKYDSYRGRYTNGGLIGTPIGAKIYTLTHILDSPENWEFDLTKIPPVGELKAVYYNGTVRNVCFDGSFDDLKYCHITYAIHDSKNDKNFYINNQWKLDGESGRSDVYSFLVKNNIEKYLRISKVVNDSTIFEQELEFLGIYSRLFKKFPHVQIKKWFGVEPRNTVMAYRKF